MLLLMMMCDAITHVTIRLGRKTMMFGYCEGGDERKRIT